MLAWQVAESGRVLLAALFDASLHPPGASQGGAPFTPINHANVSRSASAPRASPCSTLFRPCGCGAPPRPALQVAWSRWSRGPMGMGPKG